MLPQALSLGSALGGKLMDKAFAGVGGAEAMGADQLRSGNINVGTKIVGKGNRGETSQSAGEGAAPAASDLGLVAAPAVPVWVWIVVSVLGVGLVLSLIANLRRR